MKTLNVVLAVFILFIQNAKSQDCSVELASLNGNYEGDCRKGKANGRGTASGADTYTGEFRNGYPEGMGKYQWKNGDWYEGSWKKGMREGSGTMHYVAKKGKDSVQAGYWKKDKYLGLYEKPYEIHSRTPAVTDADFTRFGSGASDEVTFTCQSITGGANTISGQVPKPTITSFDVVNGQYQSMTNYDNLPKSSKTTFRGLVFPFRIQIHYGTDIIDVEIFEPGNWTVELKLQR